MSLIERFLDANRITQTEVAQALEVDPSTISRKLRGEREWKLPEVQAVIAFLSARLSRPVTYEDLFADPETATEPDKATA